MATRFVRLKGNKNITIILAIAAVAVWTSVALRMTEPSRPPKIHSGKIGEVSNENFKDSAFTLRLNYEDPFHLSVTSKPITLSSPRSNTSAKAIVRRSVEAPDIFYLGSAMNALGDRKALIKYRSKYYYADVNDTIGTFRVMRVCIDSITLVSSGRIFKTIRRSHIQSGAQSRVHGF